MLKVDANGLYYEAPDPGEEEEPPSGPQVPAQPSTLSENLLGGLDEFDDIPKVTKKPGRKASARAPK